MSKFKVGDTIPVSAILTITGVQPTKNGSARYNTDHAINLSEAILDQITIKGKPATVKAVEPQDKQESVKLYCVEGFGDMITAGKVYTFDHGICKYDNGYKTDTHYRDYEDYKRKNVSLAAFLVPLVARPAKVGEWVYVVDAGSSRYAPNQIYQVYRLCDDRVWFADDCKGNIAQSGYLVLDGYAPEQPKYWSGKVVCVKSVSGVFTAGRSYDFANGAITKSDSGLPYGAESICGPFETLEDFNRWSKFAQFIEYKGEA